MATKKIKNNNLERKKYIYIGDYYNKDNKYDDYDNNNNLDYKVDLLIKRLNVLESIILSPSKIIKAKPVLSILSGDIHCLNKINNIYEKWINYISNIAHCSEIKYNVTELFWQLDKYIFNNYFLSLKDQYIFEFEDVDLKKNYTEEQLSIIKQTLSKNRNDSFKLLYPHHKEYISTNIIDNRIFLFYFDDELQKIINYNNDNKDVNKDLQFSYKLIHPNLCFNKDVTGEIEMNAIKLNGGENKDSSLEFSNLVDKRQLILQNKKPLYNTLVDIEILNKLNSTLFRFNPVIINLSLIIFHSMLHIKRDINNDNIEYNSNSPHDLNFMKEYLNFTPSALYGHAMIPPLTLS